MPRTPPVPEAITSPVPLAELFDDLTAAGRGWVNVMPEIPDGVEVPLTPNALAIFSKRGPFVPLGTWTAPSAGRGGRVEPSEVGIQHGAARRGIDALAEHAAAPSPTWTVASDHPRRGVVVRPSIDATTTEVATWLLGALRVLCIPPQTGRFVVYRYGG
ncbi:MAG: hypothetical protein R2698_08325 [Microthrixaceae bacterium]